MTSAVLTASATSAWDQYWRDGRLASCGGAGGANYQPVIAEGWRAFFDRLRDAARVLDICTGNGAVARLAAEVAAARNIRVTIDAVDSATINPLRQGAGVDMIRFSSRTAAESLPFAADTFDVIVGQYAIEYTDVERSMVELRRVSRPDAAVRFVTHHAHGCVAAEATRQIADADRLLATGIFAAAETLARSAANAAGPQAPLDARANFQTALQALQHAAQDAADRMMYRNVGTVLVHALQHLHDVGAAVVLDKIAETEAAIRSHQARLAAMSRAALDEPAARALCARAESLWNRVFDLQTLQRGDGAVFGWVLASTQQRRST